MTRRTLALCCAPQVLVALDFALLAVAAPGAQAELELGDAATRWLFSAYSLAFGCLLLPAGRLADTLGRGVLLRAGLALFAVAATLAALAPNSEVLLVARVLGGAGAAAMTPAALALIAERTREGPERRAAMSAYGTAIAVGFVAGALAGGALSTVASWRPLFAAEACLAAATLAGAAALDLAGARRDGRIDFDVAGVLLGAAAVTLALAPLPWRGLGLAAAAACGWAFWLRERRAARPLLPLAVLDSGVLRACAAGLTLTATGVAATVLLTAQLQDAQGLSPLQAGAVLAVFGSTALPGAWLVRRLDDGMASRVGLAVQGAALVAVAASIAGDATSGVVVAIAAFGLGHVAANAGVAQVALRRVAATRQGAVGATLATAQYLGAAAGPLLFGAAAPAAGIAAAGCAAALACVLIPSARSVPVAAR